MVWWILTIGLVAIAGIGGIMVGTAATYGLVARGKVFNWRQRDYVCRPAKADDYPGARGSMRTDKPKWVNDVVKFMDEGTFDASIARAIARNDKRKGI